MIRLVRRLRTLQPPEQYQEGNDSAYQPLKRLFTAPPTKYAQMETQAKEADDSEGKGGPMSFCWFLMKIRTTDFWFPRTSFNPFYLNIHSWSYRNKAIAE